MKRLALACVMAGLFAAEAVAGLELGGLFKDHAVVQRDKRVAVWGRGAKPFARVEAALGKVKGAYETDPLVATLIGAVTQSGRSIS